MIARLFCSNSHIYTFYIVPMAMMSEKRDDDNETTPLQVPYPRSVRHNFSSLAGLFLIFLAAITYGSYFYGIPGHAVKSQAEVILAENPLGANIANLNKTKRTSF